MRFSREANRYYTYILSSPTGTLYTGVTNDIKRRLVEHRTGLNKGFSHKYTCKSLVYVEMNHDVMLAIAREKQIKNLSRANKEALIRERNRSWRDLSKGWILPEPRAYEGG